MARAISRLLALAVLAAAPALAQEQHARWLDNTFRIDPSIREITLFIERETPSAPVVLIRPDGSKYYQQRHPDNISWVSTPSRDIITLWRPTPGPWQATGKVNAERGISLLSLFRLELEPLPPVLFQNEVVKLGAWLKHDDTVVDAAYYLDGLSLDARLLSPAAGAPEPEQRFEQAPIHIGAFADDGTGLDEYPGDGKMTAEVVVDALPGNYLFQAQATNRVLARAYEQEVLIHPMPLSLSFSTPSDERQWRIDLALDSNLEPDSLEIIGQLFNPLEQRADVTGRGKSITLPPAIQPGNYRFQGRAFATTVTGREIQIALPEQVVRVAAPAVARKAPAAVQPWWKNPMLQLGTGMAAALLLAVAAFLWWRRRRSGKG